MNLSSIIHEPKSSYCYAYNNDTIHIRLKTAKNEMKKVLLLAVDPFNWVPKKDNPAIYEFEIDSILKNKMEKEQVTELYDCWFIEIKGIEWRRLKYCFIVENNDEKFIIGSHDRIRYEGNTKELYDLSNYFNYPYINEEDLYICPEWVSETVWYQIFPERFAKGKTNSKKDFIPWGNNEIDGADKKFGGNLNGVIDKLDYIKEFGFTGIYFNPIFESPSSHKYDTTNYYKIDPEFGDNETFKILVEEAHKRGIKVMLDGVFNHCGFLHPFWQDVCKNGINSKYYDCFYILDPSKSIVQGDLKNGLPEECSKEKLNYRTFAFTQSMPKWNTKNKIVRDYLIDVGCYWVKNYNIDGWRLDVSNEVSHDFWREFRKKIRSINEDIYILGENWDNSYPWLQGDQFDAVMNYEFTRPVWNFFRDDSNKETKYDLEKFKSSISKLLTDYPKNITKNMFNLLDSHDTARIFNIVGKNTEIAKLAYVFMMTFPGCPCIYYGSEIGLDGDEHSNRKCMIWDESKHNKELFTTIKKLINLRKKYKSFNTENMKWINMKENLNIILYKKSTEKEILYVVLNNSSNEANLSLPDEIKQTKYINCYSDEILELQQKLLLKPYEFKLLLKIKR
ncbi:glycoside hydrolase family 13 protein [Clostridium weizhouense]|uniref:Alpha-glycosidase n=1 Tax=Clostridium weizhouense TaxID=2859781 RepID=A0ABS7AL30_9CLOT|nr:glycoside hydrolase family 13 protein [Clostridium weizhouense]MBW6409364.1 alpha-glycosidase [Clostridium weizhouense]